MSTLRRPEIVQDFDPGEVPIGSILWFVGNEDRYKQILDSKKWIGCDGQQIIINPSVDYDLFEALGGIALQEYLNMTDEERQSNAGKALLDKVSPLLNYVNNFTVLNGVSEFSVINKRIENNERKTLVTEDGISSYNVPSSTFKNLGNASLTGTASKWSTGGYNGNFEWKNDIDLTWPLFVFNSYLGLTFVAGSKESWYDQENSPSGSYINSIPATVSGSAAAVFPYNISKGIYGREYIEYQQVMENADFSERKGPYYVADSYIESGDFIYGVTTEITAEGFSIQDVNGKYIYDGENYVKVIDSTISYKLTSHGCCIRRFDSTNTSEPYVDVYEGGTNTEESCLDKQWYRVTDLNDHQGWGNSEGVVKPSDILEETAKFKMKKNCLYLKDFIDECNKSANAGISGQMFAENYQKWFTTQTVLVPAGEEPDIKSYFNELITKYNSCTTGTTSTYHGSLRATTYIKNETLKLLNFISDNLIISNNGTNFVFSVPAINEGESIVATKNKNKIGTHTNGGLPNLVGTFTGAGRSNYSGAEDNRLFQAGQFYSGIGASGHNGITIAGREIMFDASKKNSIYNEANKGVLPAGCFAKAIMRIK